MEILYEDNHLIVVVKPPGILTQPSGTDQENLESQAKEFIKKRDQKPGNVFLEAIHRLDKPVGGIVVFAKTSKALSRLNATQREKKFRKIYRAFVSGSLPQEGTLEHHLLHEHHRSIVHPDGKKAILKYRILKKQEQTNLIEIELHTGRYHQIRVQFAHIGCPILGDHKYGSDVEWETGIALFHCEFQIEHPISKEQISFQISENQYPRAFRQFL